MQRCSMKSIEIIVAEYLCSPTTRNAIIRNDNPMFDKPTVSASRLREKQKELMKKYNLTKSDITWKK